MIMAWSAICNHNCIFPEVFVVIFIFSFILGFVVGGFTIQFPDFMVLVFLVCWECTPSIVWFVWFLPGSNSTGSWFHMVGGVVLLFLVVSYLA